jgi:hypothetical protein
VAGRFERASTAAPVATWHDGVRFEEVSVGCPREWQQRSRPPGVLRRILPAKEETPTAW